MSTTISTPHGDVTVKTNGAPRPLVSWHDLTAAQRAEIDYLDESERHTARLFIYRGSVYDFSEFDWQDAPEWIEEAGFTAWQTESAFSAVLVTTYGPGGEDLEGDAVVVGYAHW